MHVLYITASTSNTRDMSTTVIIVAVLVTITTAAVLVSAAIGSFFIAKKVNKGKSDCVSMCSALLDL